MLTTFRIPPFPSPEEGGSSPSNLAVIRKASISCLTLSISCSFIRSTSMGFFMGRAPLINNQRHSNLPPQGEKHHEGTRRILVIGLNVRGDMGGLSKS